MTFRQHVMGAGNSAASASSIVGGVNSTSVGAGTVSTNAALLPLASLAWIKTAANNSGVILPPGNGSGDGMQPGDYMIIYNGTVNSVLIYPPAGGTLNGASANASFTLPTLTGISCYSLDGTAFYLSSPTT